MARFWEQFNKSNVISGALALLVWGLIAYLAIEGRPIPDGVLGGGLSIIGFFFGSRVGQGTERVRLERLILDLQAKVVKSGL